MLQFGTSRKGLADTCWGLEDDEAGLRAMGCDWRDLDADEYVFPQRVATRADAESFARVTSHCRRALAATVAHAVARAKGEADKAEIAARLTAMPLDEALALGAVVRGDFYATRPLVDLLPGALRPVDLEAISLIDAALAEIEGEGRLAFDATRLTQLAYHAAFNPVVVCPEAFSIGELLTVAAWLGLAARGRKVMLPRFVANYWLTRDAETDEIGTADDGLLWEPDAFLAKRAQETIGLARLLARSLQVMTRGARTVRPALRFAA